MSKELQEYIDFRISIMRDLKIPNDQIESAHKRMANVTSEIQVDNIVKDYRYSY